MASQTQPLSPTSLAVLGTGSDVGKSTIVAGICRILSDGGLNVAPFKAQNMSNNSWPALITPCADVPTGERDEQYGEIGVAQAIQAQASRQPACVEMNPVLLKSGGRRSSDGAFLCSVHVMGKLWATEDYGTLGERTSSLMLTVLEAHSRLGELLNTDVIVLEGAGSCTELNLQDRDIVNIPLIRKCPWLLVANIDPGGVFAQIVGTKACLSDDDWNLCAGVVVNKLRGDVKYFEPGPCMLEKMVGKPIFVLPYLYDMKIPEEDSSGLERKLSLEHTYDRRKPELGKLRVVVVCYPHMSMMDDVLPLEVDSRFQVEWRRRCIPDSPDVCIRSLVILLPGSRQTRADLEWLMSSGWRDCILQHASRGGRILGICGGYQILGHSVTDEEGVESGTPGSSEGLAILPVESILESAPKKVVRPQKAMLVCCDAQVPVQGYEIHCGRTLYREKLASETAYYPMLRLEDGREDGIVHGNVYGTYLHGLLRSSGARSALFGLTRDSETSGDEIDELDRLADHLRDHGLDFSALRAMIDLKGN